MSIVSSPSSRLNVFDVDATTNRVRTVSKCIDVGLEKFDTKDAAEHKRRASQFCRRIRQRINEVRIEMGLPADPLVNPNPNSPRRRRQPQQ
jgi:cupin superfamily acireductone dioxygenase involved in methionine salvage